MLAVSVIKAPGNRSRMLCTAMDDGIKKYGDTTHFIPEEHYTGPHLDAAVFYGLAGRCKDAFLEYKRQGKKAVYIDLGYWNRVEGGKLYGYHKIAVNSRHPTAYFQKNPMPWDRWQRLGIPLHPWQPGGRHILVAGMGAKAAAVEGFLASQWETAAIQELARHTDRPIIYRPKPSWRHPQPIEGARFSSGDEPLEDVLRNCHAVVSHHSNVCVDSLVFGVPVFCWHGVASVMGLKDLSLIEHPIYPEGREQWVADIAYTQWRADEMRSGEAWRHLREQGIV